MVHREIRVGDAGVVDENVEAVKLAADRAEQIVHGMRIADVAGLSENADFLTRQFPADTVERGLVASGENQVAAFCGESAGDGESDAAGGAGNESDLTAQAEGV